MASTRLLKNTLTLIVDMSNSSRQPIASRGPKTRLGLSLILSVASVAIVWALGQSQRVVWMVACAVLYWSLFEFFLAQWRLRNSAVTEASVRRKRLLAILPVLVIPPLLSHFLN